MILSKLVAKVLPLVLKAVLKAISSDLKPLQAYVFKKNDLDEKCEEFEKRIRKLEEGSFNLLKDNKGKWYEGK